MSNQNATHNRVTLLESIEAARRSIIVCRDFHGLVPLEYDSERAKIWLCLAAAANRLRHAIIHSAVLEAWGDGP